MGTGEKGTGEPSWNKRAGVEEPVAVWVVVHGDIW